MSRYKSRGNFSIGELEVKPCLRTPDLIRDRYRGLAKMSIELHP